MWVKSVFPTLCPKQSGIIHSQDGSRVLNQLLTEMDCVEDWKGVFIMEASNNPAVLRPGRLVSASKQDRFEILQAQTKVRG